MIWPASLHGIKHQTWRVSLLGNTWAVFIYKIKKVSLKQEFQEDLNNSAKKTYNIV